MAGDRDLTPDDAAVALRSFPRRFRGVFTPSDDDDRADPDEAARRPGPDGVTAAEHLASAIGLVRSAGSAASHGTVDDARSVPDLLAELDEAATEAAHRVEAVPSADWTSEALHLVQDAVAAVAVHLRGAQAAVSS